MDFNIGASGNGTAIQALKQVRSLSKLPLASTNIHLQAQQPTMQHVISMIADIDRLIKDYPYVRHTLPNLRNGIITLSRGIDTANSSVDTFRSFNDDQQSTVLSLQQKIAEYDDIIAELINTCEKWEKSMVRVLANINELNEKVKRQQDNILNAQETIDSMRGRICELYQNIDEKDKAAAEQDTKLKEIKQRDDNQAKIIMAQAQTKGEHNETTRKLKENKDVSLANEQCLVQLVEKQNKEIREQSWKSSSLQQTINDQKGEIVSLKTIIDVQKYKLEGDFNRRLKEAEKRQAGVLAMRHDEIRDLQRTIEEKNKAIESLQFENSAHLQTITSTQEKHDAEKAEQLELQKQSALESVQRDADNIYTIECLTEEVKTKNAEIGSLQARVSEVDLKTVENLKWELREKEAIIATLVGLRESTKATVERRGRELLDRIQYISREVEVKNEIIEDLQRQQKKAEVLAETRIKDLVAAQTAIQNLADDYDDLVENNEIREQELNDKIKVLEAGGNPGYAGARAALSMSAVANSNVTTQVPVAPALARIIFLNPLSGAHHTGNRPRLGRMAISVSSFQDYLTPKGGISYLFSPKNRTPVTNTSIQNLSVGMSDSKDMQADSGSDCEESEAVSSNYGRVQIDFTNESESEAESDTPSLSQIPENNEENEFEDEDDSSNEERQGYISETDNEDDDEGEQPSEDDFKTSGYERLLGFYPPHAPARKSSGHSMGSAASTQSHDSDPSTQIHDSDSPPSAGNKRTRYDVDKESRDGNYGRDDKRARYAQEPVSAAEMLRRVGEKLKADFGRL